MVLQITQKGMNLHKQNLIIPYIREEILAHNKPLVNQPNKNQINKTKKKSHVYI